MDVTLGNWELINPTGKFHPKTLTLHAHSDKDTTRVSFHAGDFGIVLTGNADIETMTDKFTKINEGLTQQLERDSMIDIPSFRPLLPDMDLKITAGKDNPIYNILFLPRCRSLQPDAGHNTDRHDLPHCPAGFARLVVRHESHQDKIQETTTFHRQLAGKAPQHFCRCQTGIYRRPR